LNDTGSAEDFGYGRQQRLLKPVEYAEAFAARRVLRGKRFALHYRANGRTEPRLGLVIPKKQARRAVLRNAIKRQAREVFRKQKAALPALDLVLRLAQPAGAIDKPAWRAEIAALFEQLPRT
jgi:ribonuclease P protein component